MKVFVDTAYLIAILNPDDELAGAAAIAHDLKSGKFSRETATSARRASRYYFDY